MLFAQSPASAHHSEDHDKGRPHEDATSEDSSTSEAGSEEPDDTDDTDGEADDGAGGDSNGGWSSFQYRDTDDREREATTTTTTSSTNPGGQVCDGSPRQESGGGANQSGPHAYESNCKGLPSGNGQGKARPCAGCVGDADDKFPPGQAPDGSDHNNGYECDGNNGIAKTNPAHTGCDDEVPPPPSVCDADETMPGIQPCVSGNPPKPPGPPGQPPGPPRRDIVLPRPPIRLTPPEVVLHRPPGVLPVTGVSPFGFIVLGLGMIATGSATLGHKRVRRGTRRKL